MTDRSADPADVLTEVCAALEQDDLTRAAATLRERYPFVAEPNAGRRYTPLQCMRVFLRDGFCDRYSGRRLVNPGVIRLIGARLPDEFPMHPNWKQSETHPAFWELFPTIDHVVPVARGGEDHERNWVTTSMLRNAAKANALLTEIGWSLLEPGDRRSWDGLSGWLVAYLHRDPQLERLPSGSERHRAYVLRWARASQQALEGR